jgi:hypothetical protein
MRFSHPLLVLCICACVRVYTGIYHVLEVCAHMCNVLETMCPNRVLQVCVLHVAGVCVCACVCVCVCVGIRMECGGLMECAYVCGAGSRGV